MARDDGRPRPPKPPRTSPPVRNPAKRAARRVGWVQGYAGAPRREMSVHQLRAFLDSVGAPVSLAMPAPTVTRLISAGTTIGGGSYKLAASVETHGVRVVTFHLKNTGTDFINARPVRIIEGVQFVDGYEDPYEVPGNTEAMIPVWCDAEVVGLQLQSADFGEDTSFVLAVGFTP